jgi:type VI secretion system protein ImpH
LNRDDQSQIPSQRFPRGLNCQLGTSVIVGERVWNVECRFRVRIGPLSWKEFQRFTPTGEWLVPLCQLTRCYVGPELDFDVQPVLRASEVPFCRAGGEKSASSRLGWNTWLCSKTPGRDADDAVFSLEGNPQR